MHDIKQSMYMFRKGPCLFPVLDTHWLVDLEAAFVVEKLFHLWQPTVSGQHVTCLRTAFVWLEQLGGREGIAVVVVTWTMGREKKLVAAGEASPELILKYHA
jgi:hypothetical protein